VRDPERLVVAPRTRGVTFRGEAASPRPRWGWPGPRIRRGRRP